MERGPGAGTRPSADAVPPKSFGGQSAVSWGMKAACGSLARVHWGLWAEQKVQLRGLP